MSFNTRVVDSTLLLSLERLLYVVILIVVGSEFVNRGKEFWATSTPCASVSASSLRAVLVVNNSLNKRFPRSLPRIEGEQKTQLPPRRPSSVVTHRSESARSLIPFHPDTVSLGTWVSLGFSEKQAGVILRYREKSGGFRSKEHFRRCYVVDERAYARLAPYLLLPESYKSTQGKGTLPPNRASSGVAHRSESARPLIPFHPDTVRLATWVSLGFSEKQAGVILRYREKSGGFRSKEHFRRCYVVDETAYQRLAPYLLLPEKEESAYSRNENKRSEQPHELFAFNPDTASAATFERLGFTPKQAQALLHYRAKLGGAFGSPERFARSYVVDSARFQALKPYLRFE